MFKISYDKKITMVQGDTGVIRMRIHNYELSQGDEVRFAIVNKANPSILLCQHSDKKIVLEKQVTVFEKDGSARIVIYPYDTEYLQPGKYLYEIQVKTKDGRIDTVVPLTSFTLMDGSIQGEFGQTTPSKPEPTPSEIELRFTRLENEIIPELGNRVANVEKEIDSVSSSLDDIENYTPNNSIIADCKVEYINGKWSYTKGTDMSDVINNLIYNNKVVLLPKGNIYLEKPLKIKSETSLIGAYDGNGNFSTRLIFNGLSNENCIEADSSFEVSHYKIKGIRITDARLDFGKSVSGGYGIFANNAVNSQLIEDCFIDSFGDGAIFVGSNTNNRAGDNIVINRCWITIKDYSKSGIKVGNFNNVCSISNIYCDGVGTAIERTNGNYLAGTLNISNVKHEILKPNSYPTIKTGSTDQVFVSSVIRRCPNNDSEGSVVKPTSNRGVYINCSGGYNASGSQDGTLNIFRDSNNNVVSTLTNYFGRIGNNEYIELNNSVRIQAGELNPEGNITSKMGSLYFRNNGLIGSLLYLKEQNTNGNTGWKEIQGIRSGETNKRPTTLGVTVPIGYMYFDTSLNKPVWFDGTKWVDANSNIV